MPSLNITESMSLSHAIVATAPASPTSPKIVSISTNTKISQIGSRVVVGIQSATTAPTAIDIGVLGGGTMGRFAFKNLDGTNNLIILTAVASGVAILELFPGEMAQGRFGSGVTAPAMASSAGTILGEYVICED